MSTILKRFEIWLLFALIASGIWWAFQEKPAEAVSMAPDETETRITGRDPEAQDSGLLEVKKVNISPTVQGTVIELTLLGRSGTDSPVTLGDGNVELLTSDGEDVHRFYLPFDPDPMLAADEKSLVILKYWLKTPVDVLWLTYRDQTLKVEIPAASI